MKYGRPGLVVTWRRCYWIFISSSKFKWENSVCEQVNRINNNDIHSDNSHCIMTVDNWTVLSRVVYINVRSGHVVTYICNYAINWLKGILHTFEWLLLLLFFFAVAFCFMFLNCCCSGLAQGFRNNNTMRNISVTTSPALLSRYSHCTVSSLWPTTHQKIHERPSDLWQNKEEKRWFNTRRSTDGRMIPEHLKYECEACWISQKWSRAAFDGAVLTPAGHSLCV